MADIERIDRETLYVTRHLAGRVAVVTLHRADKLNAGSPTMFREIGEVMTGFDGDDDVGAVVLTGEGKAFSAGADLAGMTFDDMENCYRFIRGCHEAFETIETLPKVVIAAVNGYAFGFGLELSLVCDLVLASDRARFGLREMNHGLLPEVTVTRGVDVVGRKRVAWMALTSEDLSPDQAVEFGFVNQVVPHDELQERAFELATRMAKRAPLAVAVTKRLLNKGAGADYREGENTMPAILASQDVAEGRAAFEERREPVYRGR